MDVEAITNLIMNIGVPTACLVVLFRYMKSREEQHDKEAGKWMETVENNTKVMQSMTDKMDNMLAMLQDSYVKQLELKVRKARVNDDDEE